MEDITNIVQFVWRASIHMLPFFVASVAVAALINASGVAKARIRNFIGSRPIKAIIVASLLGSLSPFCSCGVIPIVSGILIAGAPIAPVLAFWISSPLMDPETFIITYGELGLSMAIGRLAAAFLMGMAAGLVGLLFSRESNLKEKILRPTAECGCACGCLKKTESFIARFLRHSLGISVYLGKWLLIAFFLEAIIVNYVPTTWVMSLLGRESPFSILIASIVGIPLYVNGIGAVPVVKGLVASGMSEGAALSFLIAGPVTAVPAMVAVTAVARKRLFAVYILISLIGAVIAGYLYQFIAG